jgi:hypothetical protein
MLTPPRQPPSHPPPGDGIAHEGWNPKANVPEELGSEEWDERHYGDFVFDPDAADKVSPEMKKWLADLVEKQKQPKPIKE